MKHFLFLICLFFSFSALSQDDFQLEINDSLSIDISTNQDYFVILGEQTIKIRVNEKDTLVYEDEMVKFNYLKDFKVSKVSIDEEIEQLVIMSAEGTGIILQKYAFINPSMLEEIMLSEITKESISYGFDEERGEIKRTILSGETLDVITSRLTYRDEVNKYEIATVGGKDYGLLILTMSMDENFEAENQKIIGLLWESLEFKQQD